MNRAFFITVIVAVVVLARGAAAQSSPAPTASPTAAASAKPASTFPPAPPAPEAAELTKLLNDFLAGASRNDAAMHDRFWAEDLIYTRSAGVRVGKAEVMRNVREEGPPKPGDETTIYTAEDIRIQQYATTAIVAFRLVGTTKKGETTEVTNYLNTGTFLKRDGKWQAVAWQATKVPSGTEATK